MMSKAPKLYPGMKAVNMSADDATRTKMPKNKGGKGTTGEGFAKGPGPEASPVTGGKWKGPQSTIGMQGGKSGGSDKLSNGSGGKGKLAGGGKMKVSKDGY